MPSRPMSGLMKPSARSSSRMSSHSKTGGGSRASDEEARTAVKVDSPQGKKIFVFDRVFGPEVDQEGVWEYLSDSINAFLQGYNVSLLAYGQSGAGKSYTMGTAGPSEQPDPEAMGVIPRAATALFEKLDGPSRASNRSSMSQLRSPARYSMQPLPKADKNWQLKATYLEIYNEQLRDLLLPDHVLQHERTPVTIREDQKGNIILTGLRQLEINSVEDLMNALAFGSSIRQTDATAINAKSSRSHAVFSLNLIQRKSQSIPPQGVEKRFSVPLESMTGNETWVTTDSKLHFVDLAGSERLKNTGAQGERAREGISINAGLAALGKVISQLSSRNAGSHVSYRDSRLTRLLQDSLGGNAITYMVACVTPAEFHLSETLNTVQYAQRARAIQSKPRIQQTEEGDKQAIIDRLKAEVAFLREQIRNTERGGGERRNLPPTERSERQNERESELQDQLLDVQENYRTLSERHAKLIAEMAKARDQEAANNHEVEGNLATERLNRSNSFAQAVEQVVLEYEKTIQSLEQSLSSTRATLSNTETNLLEKETRCAYVETINTQLQARLHKLMDREANTESYLHDLEAKLDGHTSGEEKNAAIVVELRKEIARIRENEAAGEDYISTLEERLAEADQDAELMQREIDRLEQVIERQRSLGKLDNLLHDLDHMPQDDKPSEPEAGTVNGEGRHQRTFSERSARSHASRHSQGVCAIMPELKEGTEEDSGSQVHTEEAIVEDEVSETQKDTLRTTSEMEEPQSPAQSKFVADKLENVTQELVDLRVEHENTITEFDLLHAKYEEALRTLAELQDQVDEARHPRQQRQSVLSVASPEHTRPMSFLSDGQLSDIKDGTYLSSQSLSSELSSAMESRSTIDTPTTETPRASEPRDDPMEDTTRMDALVAELGKLKVLANDKEAAEKELADKYAQLEEKHQETLDMVEELKTEVMKAKQQEPASPRTSGPVIRRKSSQNVMIIDRAHRSFAALRNLATDYFEHQPDVMQNFEVNLNAAMHELHARSERIQELEADVANARKEMETKMTIISGLTRERSSLKSSPKDISMVGTLRDQLEQNERQLQEMHEAHVTRENELKTELEALRASINDAAEARSMSNGAMPNDNGQQDDLGTAHEKKIAALESELSTWESRHQSALEAMQETERQMKQTITELEAEVASVNAKFGEAQANARDETEVTEVASKHQSLVTSLRTEIDEYRAVIDSNALRVAELEQSHAATKQQLDEASKARDDALADLTSQKELIDRLEYQLTEHEEALAAHKETLDQLRSAHAQEIDELKINSKQEMDELKINSRQELESQIASLMSENAENIKMLENELADAREDLMRIAKQVAFVLGIEVDINNVAEHIEYLEADRNALTAELRRSEELEGQIDELSMINDTAMRDLEAVKSTLNEMLLVDGEPPKNSYPTIQDQLAAIKKRMTDLENKNKKHSRLVEELEDQLQSNYDQAQLTNNRLSTLQSERNQQLEEAIAAKLKLQAELESTREQVATLQARVEEAEAYKRDNPSTSHVRKTGSVTSLPSPPPAIPLPPLPSGTTSPTLGKPASPSGNRPGSNEMALSQIRADQEARINSIDKALEAERQLTSALEEAFTELERQSNKVKADCDAWRKRAAELETEVKELREKPQQDSRWRDSLQQIEEERKKREAAERAHAHLERSMKAIDSKKKKKGSLNCF
ncbi:hypothetical protein DL764_001103 [Monosporascus ibericus]|uniref:Kinesin motor domain-containing protein n=1 Tax=Monosporascus ibericus TaxID=155417 RepID=A0A4Q4TU62_9PEZI|nr:hypothetical protein DL764_001103 [Monosporascus ibericus]